jgi:hypothetical protein
VANAGVANGKAFERSFLGGPRAAWGSQNPEGEWPCRARGARPLHVFCQWLGAGAPAPASDAGVLSAKFDGVRNRATISDSRSNFHTRVGYRTNVCRRRLASDLARASDYIRPKGLTRITMTGCPVPYTIGSISSFR